MNIFLTLGIGRVEDLLCLLIVGVWRVVVAEVLQVSARWRPWLVPHAFMPAGLW
jgi:hypothetical protein